MRRKNEKEKTGTVTASTWLYMKVKEQKRSIQV
jgi:hypothetical protein